MPSRRWGAARSAWKLAIGRSAARARSLTLESGERWLEIRLGGGRHEDQPLALFTVLAKIWIAPPPPPPPPPTWGAIKLMFDAVSPSSTLDTERTVCVVSPCLAHTQPGFPPWLSPSEIYWLPPDRRTRPTWMGQLSMRHRPRAVAVDRFRCVPTCPPGHCPQARAHRIARSYDAQCRTTWHENNAEGGRYPDDASSASRQRPKLLPTMRLRNPTHPTLLFARRSRPWPR
jgi:hypothetical protein